MISKKLFKKIIDVFMNDISSLGGSIIYGIIFLFVLLFGFYPFATAILISYILVMLLTILIRSIYFKHRPKKQKHTTEFLDKIDASSFPSAHAGRTITLLTLIILFLTKINVFVLTFTIILALFVIYSRYYLKKHHFFDLLAGIVVGFICAIISRYIVGFIF